MNRFIPLVLNDKYNFTISALGLHRPKMNFAQTYTKYQVKHKLDEFKFSSILICLLRRMGR